MQKIQKYQPINLMSQLIPQFQPYKGVIPEFIIKLYHILQKKQYEQYLCWNGDDQVLIKSGKKLQQKVLPHFFRHKHLSSFIRQLNMYKFSKVAKLSKQRNHMYFKNEYFQRGKIKQLTKIKRNNKKNRQNKEVQTPSKSYQDDDVSIMQQISQDNQLLINYKGQIRKSFLQIKDILAKVIQKYPQTTAELVNAKKICDQVMEIQQKSFNSYHSHQSQSPQIQCYQEQFQKNGINNMLTTQKNIPKFDGPLFISQISSFNFNFN